MPAPLHASADEYLDELEVPTATGPDHPPPFLTIGFALLVALVLALGFVPFWDGVAESTGGLTFSDMPIPPPEQLPIRGHMVTIAQFGDAADRSMIRADPISLGVEVTLHGSIAADQSNPIVTDAEAHAIEQQAVTILINRARTMLETHAHASGLHLEETTIRPSATDMGMGLGYERTVTPGIGEVISAPDTGFAVHVRAIVSALATPRGYPLAEQLHDAVTYQLAETGQISPTQQIIITDWHWDGRVMTVDGFVYPSP